MELQFLSINQAGFESGVSGMAALGDLPLLQDTAEVDAWSTWNVTYRDVWILDGANRVVGVLNLTENDLSEPDNAAALTALVLQAAAR